MKAFAYLRVSGKDQVKGDGFTRQLQAIKAHAAAAGLTIAKVYRDEGVSGTIETMDRPAYREMIQALHSNGVKAVIVERLDRLARELRVQEMAIADLQQSGFTLISTAEPDLMASDPSRVFVRQLMGAMAEYDKRMIVAKLAGARARKRAATGRCEGRKPFGHYPGETAILERLQALRASGLGFDRIAAAANAEGLPTRSGGLWYGCTVNGILTR